MKHSQSLIVGLIFAPVLVTVALAAPGDKIAPGKVISKAEMWLPIKTRFGGFSLPAGQYLLQYRVAGADHIMSFIQLRPGTSQAAPMKHRFMPAMVACSLEPLQTRARRTAFYSVAEGDANRAIKLVIKGENVAHVFPMPATSGSQ